MSDRFILTWPQLKGALADFMLLTDGFEHLLLQAYNAVTEKTWNADNVGQIKHNIRSEIALKGKGSVPWVFYDMLAKFVEGAPPPIANRIQEGFRISTKQRPTEVLRITSHGIWQIAWSLGDNTALPSEDSEIALDWYAPPEQDNVPIVPTTILDYVAGSASLLKSGLILPAGALATIAIESALWDSLSNTDFDGFEESIEYESVTWSSRSTGDKLLIGIDGANRPINKDYGGGSGSELSFDIKRMHTPVNATKVKLQVQVSAEIAEFLSTSREKTRSTKSNRKLTTAFEKARKENLPCLSSIPPLMDKTLIGIRNNLVHLSTSDSFNEAVQIPTSEPMTTFEDIQSRPDLLWTILFWAVELINEVYGS